MPATPWSSYALRGVAPRCRKGQMRRPPHPKLGPCVGPIALKTYFPDKRFRGGREKRGHSTPIGAVQLESGKLLGTLHLTHALCLFALRIKSARPLQGLAGCGFDAGLTLYILG